MTNPLVERLLPFARSLQDAATFRDVLERGHREIQDATGYQHVWMFVFENEDEATLLDLSSPWLDDAVREDAGRLTIKGDAMLEEIARAEGPVVVLDARTDPRVNHAIVEKLQNRTIINIPLRLLDAPLGALGLGTFGEEGCRPPSPEELEYLIVVGSYVSIAAGRIRFIEERARAEQEKRALEHRIFQAQKLESLGVLAGGIAHDFNNILTIVLASAGLLRTGTSDATALEDVDAIIGAAERGRAMTRQLLVLSRSSVLDLQSLDLNERLRELLVLLRRILPENMEIDLIEASSLPKVEADAGELDQLFMNLCINARDAMPAGGRLTFETMQVVVNGTFTETYPWARPGRYVLVTVTDTGTGMAPEVVEHIFEPFFTTKDVRGTGLGLAGAYGIVRQHGGMIHVYSEPGVGTTFKVYLPAFSQLASEVAAPLARSVPRGNERILVAEDDPSVRGVIERILRTGGYDVTTVANGEEALQRAAAEPFGLVILDTIMPRLSGPEALEAIRSRRPETRFILSSGYLGAAKDAAARVLPHVRFLEKPYDPDGLLRKVRSALDD
jgi:signal transduction histidine kinase